MTGRPHTMAKGWCPGALTPMASGDGLIVRLKPTGGIVSLALAEAIARWSRDWGNGEIDLTSRANLQLRGLTSATLPALRDAMATWGLLDTTAEAEAIRNVVASPLAGLDPIAALDVRPVVAELERRLVGDPSLHALPPKFGFGIDDGGRFGLAGVPGDVMFRARTGDDGAVFDIGLDGAPSHCLGPLRPNEIAEAAAGLGRAFLARLAEDTAIRRMRDWVARDGIAAVAAAAGFDVMMAAPAARPASGYLGRQSLGRSMTVVGLGLPFGRMAAAALAGLAAAADRLGGQDIRLTPWRAVLVPLHTPCAADGIGEAGFIVDPNHPLRRVAACVGAPACINATTDVRADATRLAALMPMDKRLHVSGCAKGCAHPAPAAVTLVGQAGRYGMVRDGAAWAPPIAENLTVDEAARLIFAEPVA